MRKLNINPASIAEEYKKRRAAHEARIPELIIQYRKEARGKVLEDMLEYWDKVVPVRLSDLYQGMELRQTLDICEVMREEKVPYEVRLKRAYDIFMKAGHSGASANLTAAMLATFCPHGTDISDAVLNFRFENKK